MTTESLLSVHFEIALAVVDHNFVVHGLACEVFHVGMHGCGGYGMHIWLADVLGYHWDAKLPHIHLLVICGRDEPSTILDERDGIDRTQMFLVLLHNFLGVGVELEDFFIGATCEEDVLLVLGRVKLHTEWRSSVGEAANDFPSFGVPQIDQFIEASTQEFSTIIRVADVTDSFSVALVCADTFSVSCSIPDLTCTVMTGREK